MPLHFWRKSTGCDCIWVNSVVDLELFKFKKIWMFAICSFEIIVCAIYLPNAEFPGPQNCPFAKWYIFM